MKQTFKTLALVTLIGGSLTACNSDDQVATNTQPVVDMPNTANPGQDPGQDPAQDQEPTPTPKPGLTGKATVTSEGVTGTATISATLDNVSLINKAKHLNGAESINADITYKVVVEASSDTGMAAVTIEDSTEVKLHASEIDPSKVGRTYSYSETKVVDGVEYEISGTLDVESGTLRPDIAVVDGKYADFYITDEGTGEKTTLSSAELEARQDIIDEYNLKGNKTNNLDDFLNDFVTAQDEGWNGKGFTVTTNVANLEVTEFIAPHATSVAWIADPMDKGQIDKSTFVENDETEEFVSIGSNNEIYAYDLNNFYVNNEINAGSSNESALVAGGVALVWNKFDTLRDDQIVSLVEETSNNKQFILSNTLSPVGNLK